MRVSYLDCETTGFKPGQVTQLSYIIETNGQIEKARNYFFTVESVTKDVVEKFGVTVELCRQKSNGLTFKDNIVEMAADLGCAGLVAQNAKFDKMFLEVEFMRCGLDYNPSTVDCTMIKCSDILKIPAKNKKYGVYKNPSLEEIRNYFNISEELLAEYTKQLFNIPKGENIGAHDSRYDTVMVYVVTNIIREMRGHTRGWQESFCKGGGSI